jgi:hypothetical protein
MSHWQLENAELRIWQCGLCKMAKVELAIQQSPDGFSHETCCNTSEVLLATSPLPL